MLRLLLFLFPLTLVAQTVDLGLSVEWAAANVGADGPAASGAFLTYAEARAYHLPTQVDANELVTLCAWQPDTLLGQPGYTVTGPSLRTIFLPAAGLLRPDSVAGLYLWTATTDGHGGAQCINDAGYGGALWLAPTDYRLPVREVAARGSGVALLRQPRERRRYDLLGRPYSGRGWYIEE